jgi:hypothetical protein
MARRRIPAASFPFQFDSDAYLLAFEEPFQGTLVGAQILDNGVTPALTPEPALSWLLALGAACLFGLNRSRMKMP